MKKVLVVDDSREIRHLVLATLGTESCTFSEAADARSAIDLAVRERPDLVIMDVNMPGEVDGIEATRIIKNTDETRNCAVIMLSGIGGSSRVEQALEAGAADYVMKPFGPLRLINKVEGILGLER
jgi:CheY-like chemotaxis protein